MTHPIRPDDSRHKESPLQHGPQWRLDSAQHLAAARWCICGAPWINEACGRMKAVDPLGLMWQRHETARPRRLAWGPFTVAVVCTSAVVVLLVGATWWLLGLGRFWAAFAGFLLLLVALACALMGYASGIAALRRGVKR
jgi:hypothetical protein